MNQPIRGAYLASSAYVKGVEYGSVAGKIAGQVKAFERAGIACDLIPIATPANRLQNVVNWAPFLPTLEGWDPSLVKPEHDFLYIRKPIFSRRFIRFLRKVKAQNAAIRIILEIPTYPYDEEMQGAIARVSLAQDRHYRKHLHGLIDRIADLSQHGQIFSVPTLGIFNGIQVESISKRTPSLADGQMHIVSVSGMCRWHGIDRAIAGLKNYYANESNEKQIFLHLAGRGPELQNLKAMVDDAHLNDYVRFYGELKQSELESIYDKCTIGLECLGCHRKKLELSSSIKSREYLAKGVPFVFSTPIDIMKGSCFDFALQVPDDESPIDFTHVANYHDKLYANEDEQALIDRIRSFAEEHVSVDSAMSSVVRYLRGSHSA